LAGVRWPDPKNTALLMAGLTGCACVADSWRGASGPTMPAVLGLSAVALGAEGGEASAAPLPGAGTTLFTGLVAVAVVLALALHSVVERQLGRAAEKAVTSIEGSTGCAIELGRMRVGLFSGCFEFRNSIMKNSIGYQTDHLLEVRQLKLDSGVGLWRCLFGLPPIRAVQVHGINVVVEKGSDFESNLHQAISKLEEDQARSCSSSGGGAGLGSFGRRLAVTNVSRFDVGERRRTKLPNLDFSSGTKECSATTPGAVLGEVLRSLAA